MRLFYFFLFLLNSSVQLVAQDTIVIEVRFFDRISDEIIPHVHVFEKEDQFNSIGNSNYKGVFYLKTVNKNLYDWTFEHPLYVGEEKQFNTKNVDEGDTIAFKVVLNRLLVNQYSEVVIKPVGVPSKVFGVQTLSVADFEIQNNGEIVLLTYPKRLEKGSELVLFDGEQIKTHFKIKGTAKELIRDYRGNTNIVCEENIYAVYNTEEKIGIATLEPEYFSKYIAPIIDTNSTKLYFSTFDKNYPAFDYFIYDQFDSAYTKVMTVRDDLMMELYRSEFKWVDVRIKLWAKNMERETGVDAQIWVGANYFTKSLYYKELYAPLFHRNDTLFIFDYYKDQLFSYDKDGEAIDSIPIYHHYHPKQTGWKKQLIQDRVTGQIYSVHEKDGNHYVRHVDTQTGELGDMVKLYYRYVEKIEIRNNKVYYIYRPFESIQKKYLYSEKLPFAFEATEVFKE
jgi:hypothetical protein